MNNEFKEKHRHFDSGRFRGNINSLINAEKALGKIGLKTVDAFLDAGCGEGRFSSPASDIVGEIISKYGFKKKEVTDAGKYHYAVTFTTK